MRGYPKGPLSKTDYENLLTMPEHVETAKADLEKLAAVDDSKIMVDQGTEKPVQISNPLPAWKRAGFRDKAELSAMAVKPTADETISEHRKAS